LKPLKHIQTLPNPFYRRITFEGASEIHTALHILTVILILARFAHTITGRRRREVSIASGRALFPPARSRNMDEGMLCFGPLPYNVFLAVLVTRESPSELSSKSKNATDEKC